MIGVDRKKFLCLGSLKIWAFQNNLILEPIRLFDIFFFL